MKSNNNKKKIIIIKEAINKSFFLILPPPFIKGIGTTQLIKRSLVIITRSYTKNNRKTKNVTKKLQKIKQVFIPISNNP